MDSEEWIADTRERIGTGSLRMMDAVDEDMLAAIGDAYEHGEKLALRLHGAGLKRAQIAGIMCGGAALIVHRLPECEDDE